MKKISVLFILFVFLFLSVINAYSVDIDGYDGGSEWNDAETQLLVNGESNSKVNFGVIKWIIEPETNNIYFCVMFKEPGLSEDNRNVGVSLTVENSDSFTVTALSTPSEVDEERFYFDGALSIDENNGVTCEIRLGLKYGIADVISGNVRFYDSDGIPSNVYDFVIENPESATDEYKHHNSGGSYNSFTSSEPTTGKSDKPTKKSEKNTTKKPSESNNDFRLLDLILSDITTKEETVVAKTENKTKKEKKDKTTVKSFKENKKSTSVQETSDYYSDTPENTENSKHESTDIKASLGIEKGDKYKTITLIAGGLTLVAISVLGTVKSRKDELIISDNNNKNDPKS